MKGSIHEETSLGLVIRVNYEEDKQMNKDLSMSFVEWVKVMFDKDQNRIECFDEESFVFVHLDEYFKDANKECELDIMRNCAKENIRCLSYKDFRDDLFLRSPRETRTDPEWRRPETRIIKVPCEIDYFISHSWESNPERKLKVFNSFIVDRKDCFNINIWFDIACMDFQNNVMKYCYSIPIFLLYCKDLLILLDRTYLTRLSCMYEIFVWFTLHSINKSLEEVVKSIKVIFLDEVTDVYSLIIELLHYDIDNSHCFDPNEELKLRYIMSEVIGLSKFYDGLRYLAKPFLNDLDIKLLKLSKSSVETIIQADVFLLKRLLSKHLTTMTKQPLLHAIICSDYVDIRKLK